MWKLMLTLGFPLLLLAPELQAARCKVDGTWYDYDAPQCNPQAVQDEEPQPQPALVAPIVSPIPTSALTTSPHRPWSEVADLAQETCRDRKYPTELDCLMAEESAYWAMRGNFAMPESVAVRAKEICVAKTTSFGSQAMCMQRESRGYQAFKAASEMSDAEAAEARNQCEQKFASWSQRGECMRTANYRHKYPHGQSQRAGVVFSTAYIGPPLGYATESEVVTFRVRPPAHREAMVVGEPPRLPEPLNIRQRAARLALDAADPELLQAAVDTLEANADYILLSAEVPHVEDVADLMFSWPATVNTAHGVRLTDEENSSVGLALTVKTGRVYLVEFVVRAFVEGSYLLTSGPDAHMFEDLGPAIQNVTVRLIPEGSGRIFLSLSRPLGKGFFFHAVAVTSVEATGLFAPETATAVAGRLSDTLDTEEP